jgi:hypothetical protein
MRRSEMVHPKRRKRAYVRGVVLGLGEVKDATLE